MTTASVLSGICLALALAAAPARAADLCTNANPPTSAELAAPGPHPVGVRTFTFVDPSRPTPPNGGYGGAPTRTLTTEVWYPAVAAGRDTAPDPSGAPYPIIIHSHALVDSRSGEAYLAQHLASRGYVVAAPDYPLSNGGAPGGPTVTDLPNQMGDWTFVLDSVLAALGSVIDPGRVGASGLSLGGLTTLLVTYHRDLRDPRVRAALPLAPPGGCILTRIFFQTASTPLLILHGGGDLFAPLRENGRRDFRLAGRPKQLVTLREASHIGFVGFAGAFDQTQHPDGVGCAAGLGAGLDDIDWNDHPFGNLGGMEVGIDPHPTRCQPPCSSPVPTEPAMAAARQHELTRIVAAAFFDGALRDDADTRCFLGRGLRRENADVRVRSRLVDTP